MIRRPVVGITPTPSTDTFRHGTFYRYCLSDTYIKSVRQAGGNPVIIPAGDDSPLDILESLDGLILSGGGDIAPALFTDQPVHEKTAMIDTQRDLFEIALMKAAAEHDVPTLAICRGIQVMGVTFGAELHQHLPDNVGGVEHRQQELGLSQHQVSHAVEFAEGVWPFRDIIGTSELMVNSFHHQALTNVPEPLRIAGRAPDGVIEAIWHPGMSFGIGVQWHPEMLALTNADHATLFDALVNASKASVSTPV